MTVRDSLRAPVLLRLREPDIRSLCGAAAYGRGDAWQRAGHVAGGTVYVDGLSAEVRGTWRRVERVTVSVDSREVQTACSCGAGAFCRHAAALLLQWVRAPQSFAEAPVEGYNDPPSVHDPPVVPAQPLPLPEVDDELQELLGTVSMPGLRELARRRGVRGGGRNKVELTAVLAESLEEPDNIDAALATLTLDERALLEALDLIPTGDGTIRSVESAYRVLVGTPDPADSGRALATLEGLGLAFRVLDWDGPGEQYVVPRSVAARLRESGPQLSRFVPAAQDEPAPSAEGARLDLNEVFLVLAHETRRAAVGRDFTPIPKGATVTTQSGWMSEQPPRPSTELLGRRQSFELTLAPQSPVLSDAELHHLAEITGGPPAMMDFAVDLLLALEVLTYLGRGKDARLEVHQELLSAVLQLPPAARTTLLTATWLELFPALDFRDAALGGMRLHARQLPYYPQMSSGEPDVIAVRTLLTRLVTRLAAEEPVSRWYDLPAWMDLLWALAPDLLGRTSTAVGEWWFNDPSDPVRRLDLTARADWQQLWEPLVESMLLGPMTWLRLLDTARRDDGTLVFRPRPEAAVLDDVPIVDGESALDWDPLPGPPLVVQLDPAGETPEITVPAQYPETRLHLMLGDIADLAAIAPDGLRYRLTRQRAQEAFDRGLSGPDLIRLLEERAGGKVPEGVRALLDAWWSSYGTVRLYDDLTVIELDDDILLRELLATTSLEGALLEVISSRLVAVQPAALPALLAELERLGYTPRVLEDS